MDYLQEYNLTKEDIEEIKNNIDEKDILEYDVHEENITKILDYFVKRNVNIKPLLSKKSYLFYTRVDKLIEILDNIGDNDLLKINDNVDIIDEIIKS